MRRFVLIVAAVSIVGAVASPLAAQGKPAPAAPGKAAPRATTPTAAAAAPAKGTPAAASPKGAPAALPVKTPAKAESAQPQVKMSEDEQAIRKLVADSVKAFNAGDAKALAAMFTADAEIVNEEGAKTEGREEIQQVYARVFKDHPKGKIEINIGSVRFVSPVVAIEEGTSTIAHEPGEAAEPNRYVVVHVKQDGRWQMASARDMHDDEATASSELDQLGWLVGNWVDEHSDSMVRTTFRWTDNHKFLLGDFTMQIAGQPAMTGTLRLGWDPLTKKIRSWVFDSEGGFGEGLWTRNGNQWIVKFSGVTRHGHVGSATNVYTKLGAGRYSIESRDRLDGGEVASDHEAVVVVREPPKAQQGAAGVDRTPKKGAK